MFHKYVIGVTWYGTYSIMYFLLIYSVYKYEGFIN